MRGTDGTGAVDTGLDTRSFPGASGSDLSDFVGRHIGPDRSELDEMLSELGLDSLEALVDQTIPSSIRSSRDPHLGDGAGEEETLSRLRGIAEQNRVLKSLMGMGYHGCLPPLVIQRNILENPAWYTAYTPYQAEISQGRLEALVNFQTMICDFTALDIANSSLLDEGTAAAEALALSLAAAGSSRRRFFVDTGCHPQTIEVIETRAWALGVEVICGDHRSFEPDETLAGAIVQYPDTSGAVFDYSDLISRLHDVGALAIVAADLLSLALLRPPGEMAADIAVGSTQRFGVPMGFGGPHAGYMATRESLRRRIPGRVVGVSQDSRGRRAYRLALQTREQHIRREKATSNICTAQVLPAVLASMYAVYHGPEGLTRIAETVHRRAVALAAAICAQGHRLQQEPFFDTLRIELEGDDAEEIRRRAEERGYNLRVVDPKTVSLALDETTTDEDLDQLSAVFSGKGAGGTEAPPGIPAWARRSSPFLTHPVFHRYRSETEMLRYIHRLAGKDVSLSSSMIPLGSCTMKLNATVELVPVTWPEFASLHPFVPAEQSQGYRRLCRELEAMLSELTGFPAVSLQPNAGSQGELAGLLVIRRYHEARGDEERRICLIPQSAHGTNPASAVMAGLRVVVVKCDEDGNIDLDDLERRVSAHGDELAALMVTYPSTHGVFEESIGPICELVHSRGGQVYMDGANFNAMVGLCRPADIGADVCHLNLHKTFCIPHGGGGPGMGPIAAAAHLGPYLPGHRVGGVGGAESVGAISATPWGSASILPISWMYIELMGAAGLRRASQVAILNANYIAHRLEPFYPVLYRGRRGRVAHECILDLRPLKKVAGVEVEDVAKRLMDYGFHAPTVSWPVPGTVMVEPTESESKGELDRFCDAMISIHKEALLIETGEMPLENSPLRNAPHPAEDLLVDDWSRPYSRAAAAYPAPWTRGHKYWPPVSRIDNAWGDRNLFCTCPPVGDFEEE